MRVHIYGMRGKRSMGNLAICGFWLPGQPVSASIDGAWHPPCTSLQRPSSWGLLFLISVWQVHDSNCVLDQAKGLIPQWQCIASQSETWSLVMTTPC